MAAVAVVVEIAVVAGGAMQAVEVAQMVVGGVAALAAEHPARAVRRVGVEHRLEPAVLATPDRVGAVDPGGPAGERRGPGRRPGRGRRETREAGIGGDGREERVGEQPGQGVEPEPDGGLERGHRRLGLAGQRWSAARLAGSSATVGCAAARASTIPTAPGRSAASTAAAIRCSPAMISGMAKRS